MISRLYSNSRNINFDSLRTIGLICIILAHTSPPDILFQIRNFDVPLMVIVSGAVFGISASNKQLSYGNYVKKRIFRLVAPTWFFLFFFFTLIYLFTLISGRMYPFSQKTIVSSFALISGIGYVWVIRVFILVALIAPFLSELNEKIDRDIEYFIILLTIYFFYELIYFFYRGTEIYVLDLIIKYFLFYLLPYGCLFGFGLRLPNLDNKSIFLLTIISLVVFMVETILNYSTHFVPTQQYKYPPRVYYLSYSLFALLSLYLLLNNTAPKIFNNSIHSFVSSSSIWIYLWHILFIYIWDFSIFFRPIWTNSFIIKFTIVLFLAIAATYLHKTLAKIFIQKINSKNKEIFSAVFLK